MTAVNFWRAMAVLYGITFLIAAWRLVVNLAEGRYGWAAAMAVCAVIDAVLVALFAAEADL